MRFFNEGNVDMKNKKLTTKEKILNTAWKLFLTQGYEETTVNQIIEESKTSRGSFYHHFQGKEDLLFCIAYFFDNDYTIWQENLDLSLNSIDKLLSFNSYVLKNLEESSYKQLYSVLYGLQVMTKGTRHILNPNRKYYKLISELMKEGIEKGEIVSNLSYLELTEMYAVIERGFTYDWCLNQGRYSLVQYGTRIMTVFLNSLRQ